MTFSEHDELAIELEAQNTHKLELKLFPATLDLYASSKGTVISTLNGEIRSFQKDKVLETKEVTLNPQLIFDPQEKLPGTALSPHPIILRLKTLSQINQDRSSRQQKRFLNRSEAKLKLRFVNSNFNNAWSALEKTEKKSAMKQISATLSRQKASITPNSGKAFLAGFSTIRY